jgi:hypothetical protein
MCFEFAIFIGFKYINGFKKRVVGVSACSSRKSKFKKLLSISERKKQFFNN